jgi:hypothetical protein
MEKYQLLKVKVSIKPHVNLMGMCLKEQVAKKKCIIIFVVSVFTI